MLKNDPVLFVKKAAYLHHSDINSVTCKGFALSAEQFFIFLIRYRFYFSLPIPDDFFLNLYLENLHAKKHTQKTNKQKPHIISVICVQLGGIYIHIYMYVIIHLYTTSMNIQYLTLLKKKIP